MIVKLSLMATALTAFVLGAFATPFIILGEAIGLGEHAAADFVAPRRSFAAGARYDPAEKVPVAENDGSGPAAWSLPSAPGTIAALQLAGPAEISVPPALAAGSDEEEDALAPFDAVGGGADASPTAAFAIIDDPRPEAAAEREAGLVGGLRAIAIGDWRDTPGALFRFTDASELTESFAALGDTSCGDGSCGGPIGRDAFSDGPSIVHFEPAEPTTLDDLVSAAEPTPLSVPEPGSAALLGLGLLGVWRLPRRWPRR